jgi:predicted PurR-regulated permease PerM
VTQPDLGDSERASLPPSEVSLAERMPRILPVDQGPGSARRRILFFAVSGALLVGLAWVFRGVLAPFLFAIVVAYVFAPVVKAMEAAMPRWVAVLGLYAVLVGSMALFTWLAVPRIAVEVERLVRETPSMVASLRDEWLPEVERQFRLAMEPYGTVADSESLPPGAIRAGVDGGVPLDESSTAISVRPRTGGGFEVELPEGGLTVRRGAEGTFTIDSQPPPVAGERDLTSSLRAAVARQMENTESHALTLLKTAQEILTALVRGVFTFFIMLMLSAYLLATTDRIFAFFRSLVRPSKRTQFDRLLTRIDRGMSGVVRGQLLIALVNGVLSAIGFWLFDVPYWPILSIIATVLSIIPIFGAILSSIPVVVFALQNGVGSALGVLVWIIGIHQVEANLLNPKIMGDSAKVHPVLVVFALLAGEHLFGIAGALLAVPVLSITQSLFLHYREVALGVPGMKARTVRKRKPVA